MAERFLPTEDPVLEQVLTWTVERDARDVRRLLAEKEYHELEHFLRPDVQEIIVKLCQTKVGIEGDDSVSFDERRIFIS